VAVVGLETIKSEAEALIQEIKDDPRSELTDGQVGFSIGGQLAFWDYCTSKAYTLVLDSTGPLSLNFILRTIGFYHVQKGQAATDRTERESHFMKAVDAYCTGAQALPEDDEEYACTWLLIRNTMASYPTLCTDYHAVAVSHMKRCPKLRVCFILDIINKIKRSNPKMLEIWKHSVAAKAGRDKTIADALSIGEFVEEMLAEAGSPVDWIQLSLESETQT
jgi:hypothetical protein